MAWNTYGCYGCRGRRENAMKVVWCLLRLAVRAAYMTSAATTIRLRQGSWGGLMATVAYMGGTAGIDTLVQDDLADDLDQELQVMPLRIELDRHRSETLAALTRRIPFQTLHTIVGAINQSKSLATLVSQILKGQASRIRMQRSVLAEDLSASMSVRTLSAVDDDSAGGGGRDFVPFIRPLVGRMSS